MLLGNGVVFKYILRAPANHAVDSIDIERESALRHNQDTQSTLAKCLSP